MKRERPLALDLFCGAGGVSVGLQRAGFDVIGIDIKPQPNYRGGTFIQGDALTWPLEGFDLIWASPPCQAYSVSRTRSVFKKQYPDHVAAVRGRLEESGSPWVIENVPGAPLIAAVILCGGAFNLGANCEDGIYRQLRRHRLFESCLPLFAPPCACTQSEKIGVYGNGGGWSSRFDPARRGYKGNKKESNEAMTIDWMNRKELSQAIPPAYSEYLGRQVRSRLDAHAPPCYAPLP